MARDLKNIFVLDRLRAKLLLIICCIVCYVNVLHNEYSMDDDFAFYTNQYVQKGVSGIPDILTHPYYSDGTLSFDYRPVASITFAIEKELFGNNPHISHGVNLLLYIFCVLLLLGVLTEVFGLSIVPAFLTALLFAIHPVHTEVVASIKNREELLSFIFCLLAFFAVYRFFLQKSMGGWIRYALFTIICLLLSFASKLTSIPMFGIMLAMLFFKGWYRKPKLFFPLVSLVGVLSVLYLLVILRMANRPVYDLENPLVSYSDYSAKIGTTAASLFFYFRFMWVPHPFSFFYGYNTIPVVRMDDPVATLSILLHLLLLIYGVYLFFRKDITGLFITSYFMAISIYSNIVMPYTGIVSERALFFPSLWFLAAICSWIYTRVSGATVSNAIRIALMSFMAVLLLVFGAMDINRVRQWHDQISLMSADIDHLGNSTLANYFYACVLKNKAEAQTDTSAYRQYMTVSKKHFHQTIDLSPTYPYGYYRLGLIYRYDEYNEDSSFYYFNKAYSLNQALTDVQYQYGRTQYEFGDMKKSADAFALLYQKLPDDTFTVFYHALLQMKTGNLAEGKKAADRFMQMASGYYQSHFDMGVYYELSNEPDNAAREYEAAIRLGCTDQAVYRYLINYYNSHGRPQEAANLSRLLR
ncbi:MAG: tetratricopeptide repeat protein [Bacteroidetes bacterium]|nr:tetratricopeptide repeat protein [Bacteroidota bacterium]